MKGYYMFTEKITVVELETVIGFLNEPCEGDRFAGYSHPLTVPTGCSPGRNH